MQAHQITQDKRTLNRTKIHKPGARVTTYGLGTTIPPDQGSESPSTSALITEAIRLVRGKAGMNNPQIPVPQQVSPNDGSQPSPPQIGQAPPTTGTNPDENSNEHSRTEPLARHPSGPDAEHLNGERVVTENHWSDVAVRCSAGDLITGLQAVCPSAALSEEKLVYLRAEPGFLLALSFWEGETIVYRLPAVGDGKGMVSIPSLEAERLLEQLRLQKKTAMKKKRTTSQAFDSRPVNLSTNQSAARVDAPAILTVTLEVPMWTHQIKEGGRWIPAAYERLQQVCSHGWGDEQPAEASNRLLLDAGDLRAACIPVVTAAGQHGIPIVRMQHDSPYYGILFRFEIDEQGNQRVTSVAADGTRIAAMQRIASVQGTEPITDAVTLPSWVVSDVLALLPTKGKITLIRNKEGGALCGHRWIIEFVSVPGPVGIPFFDGVSPYAKVTVPRSLLQRALKTISHKFEERNVPRENRCVTLETSLERGALRVVVPLLSPSIQLEPTQEISLLEFSGPACAITVSVMALEQGLAHIERNIELTWWAPPASYPFLLRPRVPNGYICGLQPVPDHTQSAEGETVRIYIGQIKIGDLSLYAVEEIQTRERPAVSHTVLAKKGIASTCSCGETSQIPCPHMQKVDEFLDKKGSAQADVGEERQNATQK